MFSQGILGRLSPRESPLATKGNYPIGSWHRLNQERIERRNSDGKWYQRYPHHPGLGTTSLMTSVQEISSKLKTLKACYRTTQVNNIIRPENLLISSSSFSKFVEYIAPEAHVCLYEECPRLDKSTAAPHQGTTAEEVEDYSIQRLHPAYRYENPAAKLAGDAVDELKENLLNQYLGCAGVVQEVNTLFRVVESHSR